jgi:two-component system OmpR family sensor kinase
VPTKPRFESFTRRITRAYVALAVALIALIAGTSSALAFILFATSYNMAMKSAQAHVLQRAQYYQAQHETLSQYAPKILTDEAQSRADILVVDLNHRAIAGADVPTSEFDRIIAAVLNIRSRFVHVPGGTIILQPDFDGFLRLMARYWGIIIPAGIVAVILAWIAARALTRRAVSPLVDVTDALQLIAGGDFTPRLLLESGSGLHELTQAYNQVAQRLNDATLERRRQETEMRQFIADAGHELRTPLTIFMGYLDALRSGVVQESSAVAKVQDTMLDESRKMRTIIEKLILLARMERQAEPAHERIDLGSIAGRAVDALKLLAGDRLRLSCEGNPVILGDDAELYEAVKNVVENAVRYAPQSPVEVTVKLQEASAILEVSDRGAGMGPVDVEHAFDRFYRGGSRGEIEGSGLGLAIAKRAIERMNGSIALRSAPDQGTTVTMRFPRA